MKLPAVFSAGLIAAVMLVPVAAAAQRYDRVVTRSVQVERHGGYRNHRRQVCTVQYRHHRRVRTCRTIRY